MATSPGSSADERIGELIAGRYRLAKVLGRGGMGGVVYLATIDGVEDSDPDRVAVKLLNPHGLATNLRERFLREIDAAKRSRGPNTVLVIDGGTRPNGELYYVMEYVDAPTLDQLIQSEAPLDPVRAVELGGQICDGLDQAHRLTPPLVHRDLKPGNIFVERRGRRDWVRIGDFGLACLAGQLDAEVTGGGYLLGSPTYMSPEQCERDAVVDQRSDLYAVGVVLYEMLSGKPPFGGEARAITYSHREEQPRPLPATVPRKLSHVVERLLAKRPGDRPPNALQAREELHAALAQPQRRQPFAVAASLVAFVVAVFLFAGWALRGYPHTSSTPQVVSAPGNYRASVSQDAMRIAILPVSGEDRGDSSLPIMLQMSLTTELSKVENVQVFSREVVTGEPREQLGMRERMRRLGATKWVECAFSTYGSMISIHAHVTDSESGIVEDADKVEGPRDEILQLQKQLALMIARRVGLRLATADVESIQKANTGADPARVNEAWRMMLQGEGVVGEDDVPGAEDPPHAGDPRPDVLGALFDLRWLGPAAAFAEELGTHEEEQIRVLLEAYRTALQEGDFDGIRRTRGALSESRRKGLEQYFSIAEDLEVEFENIQIVRVDVDVFSVTYLRRDHFLDNRSGEEINLAVQLENAAVFESDQWTLRNKKPILPNQADGVGSSGKRDS